ncbi:MAG: single-stranded DNA-binding protein, partial [Myxococcota bacterium]|nr:single-stranded DNA-binding protein [Myxococcota bacterium]
MSSINKVIIVGNLGRDPESRQTQSGKTLARFSVATSDRWTDRDGNRQERTEWHNIKAWGTLGDQCQRFLKRGSKVYVEGRIESRVDQQNRKFTDIVANEVVFLDARAGGGRPSGDEGSWGGGSSSAGGSWGNSENSGGGSGGWGGGGGGST